jgi:hypothetical protein
MSPILPDEDARTILINRVSWSAVFSGVALALAVQIVLNLLGIGVGAASIDPLKGDSPSGTALSVGALAWWTVAGIIASFIGGAAAGRLAGEPRESTAGWHGLTSWAATVVIIALAITLGVGKVIGGTMNLAGLSGAAYAGANGDQVPGFSDMINRATGVNANIIGSAASSAGSAIMSGNPADIDAAREKAAQALAQSKGIPIDQARQQVRSDEMSVRQSADTTAKNVSRGALLSAFALILGAIAAWVGGRSGAVKPTVTNIRLRQEQLH